MRLPLFSFIILSLSQFLAVKPAFAICPICTIAVGAGLGVSRFLGIDDTITGTWTGGLIISISLWTTGWLVKKGIKLGYLPLSIVTITIFSALTLIPLWITKIIGHPFNTILGIDKLIFGVLLGASGFLLATQLDKQVRRVKGRQLFIYQKVVFPLSSLAIISLILAFTVSGT
ncbi:MAG: hypothetical protein C4584_01925 [Armatimonadetes bacterium]|nr:MAG: hypothetical protein C4584_01925 [Armatimonadota bacterium]